MSIWSAMVIVIFVLLAKINNKLKSHGNIFVWQNKDFAGRQNTYNDSPGQRVRV